MSHGNTVVNSYGVEFRRIAAHALYLLFDNLSYLMQVSMSGDELRERVDHGDDGFSELFMFHASRHPKGACSCHFSAFGANGAS